MLPKDKRISFQGQIRLYDDARRESISSYLQMATNPTLQSASATTGYITLNSITDTLLCINVTKSDVSQFHQVK